MHSRVLTTSRCSEYFYNHTRWGFGGSLDYKVSGELRSVCARHVHKLQGLRPEVSEYDICRLHRRRRLRLAALVPATACAGRNYQISDLILGGNQVFSHSYIRLCGCYLPLARRRRGRQPRRGLRSARIRSESEATGIGNDCVYNPRRTKHLPAAVPLRGKRSHLRPHPVRPARTST